ncbi:MAG: PAS domain-containing protein [Acidimicrobiales bacterium]|nr:PAS domain-containing protein [Acidimicrobiales bacterium]
MSAGARVDGLSSLLGIAADEVERRVEQRTQELARELELSRERARRYRDEVEEHAVLRAILEAAPVAIFWTDRDGGYLGSNSAFLKVAGVVDGDGIVGRRDTDVFAAAVGPDAEQRRAIVGGAATQLSVETKVAVGDAVPRPYMLTVAPLSDEREVIGVLGVLADLTDLRQLEAQLSQAQRLEAIGALAAGIAHEINTPLQYISSHLTFVQKAQERLRHTFDELAELEGSLPEAALERWREIRRRQRIDHILDNMPLAVGEALEGVETVSRIVRAMKEFAHPGNEQKAPTDLNRAIAATLVVCRNEYKYVAEVTTDFDDRLPKVAALEGELKQVLLNIIVNAAHAVADRIAGDGTERGSISVTTRYESAPNRAVISITDDGIGMSPQIRARIFDPFFTTKEVGRGSGQGLALAHQSIVVRHNGQIIVDSVPGEGSTFTIRLPIGDQPPSREPSG